MKSSTQVLRALLDERGVEHYDSCDVTEWVGSDGEICHTSAIYSNGASVLVLRKCTTPEQAIAATLGAGTCKQEEHGWSTEGDHARVWLTCGHDCMVETVADLPHFCPTCGAKVVDE